MHDLPWLEILRCPITGQTLRFATAAEWPGSIDPNATEFLITRDNTLAYPIRNQIPQLLPENAIRNPNHEF